METPTTRSDYEQERGKPMPSVNHSLTQTALIKALLRYDDNYRIMSELTLELGELRITPDICVYPRFEVDFTQDRVRMTEPPLLAVEIESPSQSTQEQVDKARQMINAGTQAVWIVQPSLQTITVLTDTLTPRTFTQGMVKDDVTDIAVDLDAVFTVA